MNQVLRHSSVQLNLLSLSHHRSHKIWSLKKLLSFDYLNRLILMLFWHSDFRFNQTINLLTLQHKMYVRKQNPTSVKWDCEGEVIVFLNCLLTGECADNEKSHFSDSDDGSKASHTPSRTQLLFTQVQQFIDFLKKLEHVVRLDIEVRYEYCKKNDCTFFLIRKLSGCFLVCTKLKAKIFCDAIFWHFYKNYQFTTPP